MIFFLILKNPTTVIRLDLKLFLNPVRRTGVHLWPLSRMKILETNQLFCATVASSLWTATAGMSRHVKTPH